MSQNRRLLTDQDFQEAMEHQRAIRVFQNDHVVAHGGVITRFDEQSVVLQSGVSDISYHRRHECEFFELRRR
ncbi:hypothetical protein [Paenibacillus xerothermodurans]|uniref:Uncharacterized protein n=1 Tax=Paenibacillus xerothermodurans TaxID=1977292 RepID=A0A2W1NRN9_PAEXE|nr:hypothetical protein [Paenibacillus xerothermodurans]PZE20406.1 hypothetical protein CBW46_013285 [Paenibacillus xerothermodurans]